MSSRFFARGDSESESSDSEFEDELQQTSAPKASTSFLDSDDEDDERKSFKSISNEGKIVLKLQETFSEVKRLARAKEYVELGTSFDNMVKSIGKKKEKDILAESDDLKVKMLQTFSVVSESLEINPKELKNKFQKKSYFSIKQKNSKLQYQFADDIERLKTRIESAESAESEEEESEDESEEEESEEEKSSEDELFESDEDEVEEAEGAESTGGSTQAAAPMAEEADRQNRWLKKDDDSQDKVVAAKKKKRDREVKEEKSAEAEGEADANDQEEAKVPGGEKDEEELTEEAIVDSLKEMLASRWRKGVDRTEQVESLKMFLEKTKIPKTKIEIMLHIVDWRFISTSTNVMGHEVWEESFKLLSQVVDFLLENDDFILLKNEGELGKLQGQEDFDESKVYIVGDLLVAAEKFDDQLIRAFQSAGQSTLEYNTRMKDEINFLRLCERLTRYFAKAKLTAELNAIVLIRIEKMYYKHDALYPTQTVHFESGVESVQNQLLLPSSPVKRSELVESMAQFLLSSPAATEKAQCKAILCRVYSRALHDDFYGARDMLITTKIPELITREGHPRDGHFEVEEGVQVLYNRVLAQLGLAAFRGGLMREANAYLGEVHCGGRMKELLAQGTNPRYTDKTSEQESAEKLRKVPMHMQISYEYLEASHLIAALILESVNLALEAESRAGRRKVVSKPLRRFIDIEERQPLASSPENQREHILSACRCLRTGKWRESYNLVSELPIWSEILVGKDEVLLKVKEQMKIEGMKSYLVHNHATFDTILTSNLTEEFELAEDQVHSAVSSMVVKKVLSASWKQAEGALVFHNANDKNLHNICRRITEKIKYVNDQNERIQDTILNRHEFGSSHSQDGQKQKKHYNARDQKSKSKQNSAYRNQQAQQVRFRN